MDNRVFTTVYQPLLHAPMGSSKKILDLPKGSILEVKEPWLLNAPYVEVKYGTNQKAYTGWVNSVWVEPYKDIEDCVIMIRDATPSQSDAAQYLLYKGNVQYNLCGEFCVLFCAGWFTTAIEDWLDVWHGKAPNIFRRVFPNWKSRPTGLAELESMFQTFEGYVTPMQTIQDALRDPLLGRPLMTPVRLQKLVHSNHLIIGCTIEGQFGRLRPSGIPHWVVVKMVQTIARGGFVTIYNPFSNSYEYYSWDEFIASVKVPYGLVVPT